MSVLYLKNKSGKFEPVRVLRGITPHIGENGNWYIGKEDTGINAEGKDGYTPVKGKDYFTEAEKSDMVQSVLNSLPTWNGGIY
jgi:hypothetical protein